MNIVKSVARQGETAFSCKPAQGTQKTQHQRILFKRNALDSHQCNTMERELHRAQANQYLYQPHGAWLRLRAPAAT
ncbi:hypothetical protein [Noviherbaspirillum agri]